MPGITSQAIVLRRADYRENDRVLTLLSPALGKITALSRGCRRIKSPLMASSELFSMGEYELYSGHDRMTVTGCCLTDTFYPLRTDFVRLAHGIYMLNTAEAAAQEEPSSKLFILLARALNRLAYSQTDMRAITCAYLLHLADIAGYKPLLDRCVRCGQNKPAAGLVLFDCQAGGTVCSCCAAGSREGIPITSAQAGWLHEVGAAGLDAAGYIPDVPLALLCEYIEQRFQCRIPSGHMHT
jgi:DNA repair protein RecO (recombination protein O)